MTAGTDHFEIKEAPYTTPGENQVAIRGRAVAVNIIDVFVQSMGSMAFSWIKFPFILGSDVAGEVVEVGSGTSRFKVSDRVTGMAISSDKRSTMAPEGAFQHYVVLRENLTSQILDGISFEKQPYFRWEFQRRLVAST
jgi:NADPH:quinone reductase-like Zn-dependent oxidoreductase